MLISKTTLSYLNDTNLKEHILYAIQNEVVLAVIKEILQKMRTVTE